MGLEPCNSPADWDGVGGHPGLAEDENDVPGPITVGGGVLGFGRTIASGPAPKRGEAPASIGTLESKQIRNGPFTLGTVKQAVDPGRGPKEKRLVVQVGCGCGAEVAPKLVEATTSSLG